jgi:NADPH2:quinone reductase
VVAAVLESGGYAEYAVADAGVIVEVPEEVDFHAVSTALLVQGITGYGVLHDAARLQKGESVLVQAAAGGAGSLAVQFARLAGAGTIVGTTGSDEKRELVLGPWFRPGCPSRDLPLPPKRQPLGRRTILPARRSG